MHCLFWHSVSHCPNSLDVLRGALRTMRFYGLLYVLQCRLNFIVVCPVRFEPFRSHSVFDSVALFAVAPHPAASGHAPPTAPSRTSPELNGTERTLQVRVAAAALRLWAALQPPQLAALRQKAHRQCSGARSTRRCASGTWSRAWTWRSSMTTPGPPSRPPSSSAACWCSRIRDT